MSCDSFLQATVLRLNDNLYKELRDILVDEYLPLALIKKENLTPEMLAEKLSDYFEKINLKTEKPFEKAIEKYLSDLDAVVGRKIEKQPKPQRNKPTPSIPRSRKYYEKACYLRKYNKESQHGLLDYTRIMLCLYMRIIKNNRKTIADFDLSMSVLNLNTIIEALRKETSSVGRKPRFDTSDPYTSDRSTFILLIIMFFYMKSKEIEGEY